MIYAAGSKRGKSSVYINKIIGCMKGKVSLVSPDAIRNHLANTSPAKISHSFTRSRRFSPANPEYPSIDPGARRHATTTPAPSPKSRPPSATASAPTSPSPQSYPRRPTPTSSTRAPSPPATTASPLAAVATRLPPPPTSTVSARPKSQGLEKYNFPHAV